MWRLEVCGEVGVEVSGWPTPWILNLMRAAGCLSVCVYVAAWELRSASWCTRGTMWEIREK